MSVRLLNQVKRWLWGGMSTALVISLLSINVQSASAAVTIYVDDDWTGVTLGADPDGAGPATAFGTDSFATIQEAVNAAAIGDTIQVYAGTYAEQVAVNKNLTLLTTEGAVIAPPETLVSGCNSPMLTNYPLVCVEDVVVTIDGFTVDGMNKAGGTLDRYFGIAYRNAGGFIKNNTITGIRGAALDNSYMGVGIYVYNSDQNRALAIDIQGNTISNFHKNGISLTTHAWPTPLLLTIQENTITGTPNATVAQNGIQVQAPLSIGTIQGNSIANIAVNNSGKPLPLMAVSILNISTSVDVVQNVINGAQLGILYQDGTGLIQSNQISVVKPGTLANPGSNIYGILVGDRAVDSISPFDPLVSQASLMGMSLTAVKSVEIESNIILYTGSLPNSGVYGIEVDAGFGANTLSVDAHHNQIGDTGQGFAIGVGFHQCETVSDPEPDPVTCGAGNFETIKIWSNHILSNTTGIYLDGPIAELTGGLAPVPVLQSFDFNRIVGNTTGVENNTSLDLSASNNWWGCNVGPNTAGCDSTLSSGSGTVTFDPWLVLTTSVDPATVLLGESTTLTADLRTNSDGVIPAGGYLPGGVPVDFSVKSLGSVLPASGFYTDGVAQSTFTAPNLYGLYEVCAATDNQETCSEVLAQTSFMVFLPSIQR